MKRLFDVVASVILLILLSPVILVLVVLNLVYHGRPVLFSQVRVGMNDKLFTMVKFRSMTNETDEHGVLLPNEKRITAFGKFLRSSSLDELPELLNVIKGDMSLVGPRPLLPEYLPLYSKEQRRRHEVRPGVTGWAQVNGRNSLSWTEKFRLDVWYVDNRSLLLDIRILFLTVFKVVKKEGINKSETVTATRFTGSEND